ncbi:MAG: hypothetical protein WD271_12725 [Acidimicrobiia bacterium]
MRGDEEARADVMLGREHIERAAHEIRLPEDIEPWRERGRARRT